MATEVLCSEIWSIVETCLNHSEQLLTPFWETVLDRSPEDMKTQMVMASHFAKINAMFLSKKPAEVCFSFKTTSNLPHLHFHVPPIYLPRSRSPRPSNSVWVGVFGNRQSKWDCIWLTTRVEDKFLTWFLDAGFHTKSTGCCGSVAVSYRNSILC